jgi:hypothetical protein
MRAAACSCVGGAAGGSVFVGGFAEGRDGCILQAGRHACGQVGSSRLALVHVAQFGAHVRNCNVVRASTGCNPASGIDLHSTDGYISHLCPNGLHYLPSHGVITESQPLNGNRHNLKGLLCLLKKLPLVCGAGRAAPAGGCSWGPWRIEALAVQPWHRHSLLDSRVGSLRMRRDAGTDSQGNLPARPPSYPPPCLRKCSPSTFISGKLSIFVCTSNSAALFLQRQRSIVKNLLPVGVLALLTKLHRREGEHSSCEHCAEMQRPMACEPLHLLNYL